MQYPSSHSGSMENLTVLYHLSLINAPSVTRKTPPSEPLMRCSEELNRQIAAAGISLPGAA
ncbi:hypothetical protein CSA37_05610 [Candidatus Fermentibacteria bacterium]|nr:MAG: hypothetical protein CSA37_05610 [Candidatus Fermentibacteria bacterium]